MTKEYLNNKADGVKDVVKWLEKRIKAKQVKFEEEKRTMSTYYYSPIWEDRDRTEIDTLISMKISIEKYMRKLRYEADDLNKTGDENDNNTI